MTVSGGVFALLQGAVADLTQELGVVAQRSDMASVDVLWVDPEVIGAEVGQPLRHRIDLGLPGHEGVERLAKAALSLRSDPLSYLHRLAPTAPAVPVPMLDSGTSSSHSSRRAPSGAPTILHGHGASPSGCKGLIGAGRQPRRRGLFSRVPLVSWPYTARLSRCGR